MDTHKPRKLGIVGAIEDHRAPRNGDIARRRHEELFFLSTATVDCYRRPRSRSGSGSRWPDPAPMEEAGREGERGRGRPWAAPAAAGGGQGRQGAGRRWEGAAGRGRAREGAGRRGTATAGRGRARGSAGRGETAWRRGGREPGAREEVAGAGDEVEGGRRRGS